MRGRPGEPQPDPVRPRPASLAERVHQQLRRTGVVGDEHVFVAVVVDVAKRRAASHLRLQEDRTRLRGDVLEAAVAQVAEQQLALVHRKRVRRRAFSRLDAAVDREQVEPPVVVEIEPAGAEPGVLEARGSQSGRGASILEERLAIVHVKVAALAVQLRHEEVLVAVVVEIAGIDPHARFGMTLTGDRDASGECLISKRPVAQVDPEQVLAAVVGDVDIGPSIVVEVAGHDPEAAAEAVARQRAAGHVGKRPVTAVPIETIGRGRVDLRRAIASHAGEVRAGAIRRDAVLNVVGDVEVEPPVAVVVHEGSGHREPVVGGPALVRDVGERAVVIVAVQLIRAEVREVEIDPAVVVDVAGGDSHPVPVRADATLYGDVNESHGSRPVGADAQVVAEQASARVRRCWHAGIARRRSEQLTLDEEHIEIAVVVEVEQSGARGHDLREIVPARHAVDVNEAKPAFLRAIDEPGRAAGRRRLRTFVRAAAARGRDRDEDDEHGRERVCGHRVNGNRLVRCGGVYPPHRLDGPDRGGVYGRSTSSASTASLESRLTIGTVRRTHGGCSSRGTRGPFHQPASAPVICDERGGPASAERHRGARERRVRRHPARRHR